MKMGGRGGAALLELCGVLLLLAGSCHCRDSQQTEHLASYQLTAPRPIGGRLRRDAEGRPPNQRSAAAFGRNAWTGFRNPAVSMATIGNATKRRLLFTVGNCYRLLDQNRAPSFTGPEPGPQFHWTTTGPGPEPGPQVLLPPDFTVFTYGPNGSLITSRPPVQNHCQYQGFVQDMEGSAVAMSVCGGLRGVMHLTNDSYGIEPLGSAPEQHLLYRLQDVTSQPRGCGTPHYRHDDATEHAQSDPEEIQHRRRSRVKRAVLHKTHYVELLLVVDNDRFKHMNGNETAVREQMIHLANLIDGIYTQLNVRVVLVGLDIWTKQNLINTEGGAGEVLSRFTQWREKELVPRRRHDSAQLILMKSFGVTAGMAYVSTVCSRSHGGGINAFLNNNVAAFASIVAHELGHNLGMNHDDGRSCSCPAAACIMHSGATWRRVLGVALPLTRCAFQNGHPCRNQQAYCYNGRCQHLDGQCQALFGPKATAAPDICFKDVNSKGDRFGNCGYQHFGYKKCESRNAQCGKLQCLNVKGGTVFGILPSIITTPIHGATCFGVDFMLGSDVPDPGMVNEGTKCGDNQVCMNFECRSADVLSYDCDVETKCHGHGVCNSNRNCHCDYGRAPPSCKLSGYGGSVDSGPTWNDKDTSLRDGLLVFFFLVLPLLALGAFVFLRRHELLRRLGLIRRKRSQGYQHQAQLLPPLQVVETSETSERAPPFAARPPPPPLKPKPSAASQPLVPQRPAPAPPV
ncbi:disintegrin and metalloproteinase domain-containing protein 9 [Poecilia reticulata]|uniref:disintegrin and metalloproteinase domain-containing protein 9 n=1 Tax=Poecilia reticulata TaxID=8081 RepID=UPI0007EAAEB3|nr:PREDICTED: disintegrin and metalloproteinase domain-containing protein 9 [Poecilia reticulata]